jgi:hypothetical protein
MFPLIDSAPLEIVFDPVSTEERLPSVAFNITAKWSMPFQQAEIIIKECWFEYSELNRFEDDLKQLVNRQIHSVKLSNMSLIPIMRFRRIGDKVSFEFIANDSADMGTVSIQTNLYELEINEIAENIKNWAKWW